MFHCYYCETSSDPHEKPQTVIVCTRCKVYPDGSIGWEIAKEVQACPRCVKHLTKIGVLAVTEDVKAEQMPKRENGFSMILGGC